MVFCFRLFKAPDPCNSYKLLNNINRRVGYTGQSPLGCDQPGRGFTEGWYRFTGAAGVRMPTKCPAKRRCGTHAPGWLEGGHPTVAQGIASRKVCYHWSSGCCQWSNYIRVRNCGAFYVYELKRTPACSLRYCGELKSLPMWLSFFPKLWYTGFREKNCPNISLDICPKTLPKWQVRRTRFASFSSCLNLPTLHGCLYVVILDK